MCSLLYTFSPLISGANKTHLHRVVLLALHLINSFPAHTLLAGCDFYEAITMMSVVENKERSTVGEELLNAQDAVVLMENKEECVMKMEAFERSAAALKKCNCYDYDDVTLYARHAASTRSYLLFQRALTTPSSNPPYPALLKPAALLLHTRLINAAIQAFSQLFVYTGSGNRGRMIEIVLENMSKSGNERRA